MALCSCFGPSKAQREADRLESADARSLAADAYSHTADAAQHRQFQFQFQSQSTRKQSSVTSKGEPVLKLPCESSWYGTGEVSGQLERTGKKIFTWNTDAWGYDPGTLSLYQSHLWVLAVFSDGKALGVLADTTLRCEIDLCESSTIKFTAAAAYPVITFGQFNSPTEVRISLSHVIDWRWKKE